KQVARLQKGVDVLVATPGRLLDLINQGFISLRSIDYFVLDEADQMLDMGFIHDIRKLLALLPPQRQSLFFSATMPSSITKLAGTILTNPAKVTIKPEQATAERVEQSVYFVSKADKIKLLIHLLKEEASEAALVFSRTKYGADKISRKLNKAGIKAAPIHGNKSQNARQRALGDFKSGKLRVLVATDIAARGIDVAELPRVVNYDLPNVPETYVHRIGRTGRAKASGIARSFCMVDERPYLRDIQRLIKQEIPVIEDHPFPDETPVPVGETKPKPVHRNTRRKPNSRSGNRSGNNNRRRRRPNNKSN
ncbi:MAG: helicase-related protein, partial [Bacteroidota bacterium]